MTAAEFVRKLPSYPTQSSDGQNWNGVTLLRYQDPPSSVEFPPLHDHRLGLLLSGRTLLENICERRRFAGWSDGGHMTLIPAGLSMTRSLKGRPDIVNLFISPDFVNDVTLEAFERDPARAALVPHNIVLDETVDRLCRLMLAEAEAPGVGGRLAAESLARVLVVHLIRNYSQMSPPVPEKPNDALAGWRLRRVVEHMIAHLSEDLPLAQVSAVSGLGPTQFARAFRAATGAPPHRYLIRLRVERARDMLEHTTLPIIEVGMQCGFAQPNHFATMFRKMTGLSPRAYRSARQA